MKKILPIAIAAIAIYCLMKNKAAASTVKGLGYDGDEWFYDSIGVDGGNIGNNLGAWSCSDGASPRWSDPLNQRPSWWSSLFQSGNAVSTTRPNPPGPGWSTPVYRNGVWTSNDGCNSGAYMNGRWSQTKKACFGSGPAPSYPILPSVCPSGTEMRQNTWGGYGCYAINPADSCPLGQQLSPYGTCERPV